MFKLIEKELKNRCYLITGSTGFIGKKVADFLCKNNSHLILLDKNLKELKKQKKKLSKYLSKVKIYKCNFDEEDELIKTVKLLKKDVKKIDVIIHNAAMVGDNSDKGWSVPFKNQSIISWKKCMDVNLKSVFYLTKELTSLLNKGNNPNIINISSIYGVIAPDFDLYKSTKLYNPAAYSVSKSALIYFTKWLASNLSPKIRVNCLSLGGVDRNQKKNFKIKYIKSTLLKRMCKEEDIIGSLVFLSTSMSSYITGQNIIIDGGKTVV